MMWMFKRDTSKIELQVLSYLRHDLGQKQTRASKRVGYLDQINKYITTQCGKEKVAREQSGH